jgi:hypothetical protein
MISTVSLSMFVSLSVATVMVLKSVPLLSLMLTLASIWPVPPDKTVHGKGGSLSVVHPQEELTLVIMTLPAEMFVKMNTILAELLPALTLVDFASLSQVIIGANEGEFVCWFVPRSV